MWPSLAGMDRSPSDGNSSENIGSTPAVPPAGPGGGAAAGEVLATGPAEVLNIEDASPEWDKVQKELPGVEAYCTDERMGRPPYIAHAMLWWAFLRAGAGGRVQRGSARHYLPTTEFMKDSTTVV